MAYLKQQATKVRGKDIEVRNRTEICTTPLGKQMGQCKFWYGLWIFRFQAVVHAYWSKFVIRNGEMSVEVV